MKILMFGFLTIFIFSANAVFAQKSEMKDWSDLFPEIAGCERNVQPLTKNGEIYEQTAVYQPFEEKGNKSSGFWGCGEITLRFEPSAGRTASEAFSKEPSNPFNKKLKVKNFDAYRSSPFCGNDIWRETIRVFFDEDKVLIIKAKKGVGSILRFVETADYELLKKAIDVFIQS